MRGWAKAARRRILAALAGLAALFVLAAPEAASAAWVKAESARFIVYGAGDERYVRAYAEKLEGFEEILRAYHGMAPGEAAPRKFEVYLVSGVNQLRRVRPESNTTTGGFYSAGVEKVYAVVRRDFGDDFILFHEYTHHFVHQHFPYGYPAWVVEGYAEYFGGTRVEDRHIDVGVGEGGRVYTLINARQLEMADLLTKRPSDLRGEQLHTFYAQAWLLTHYMLSDPKRKKQMDAYLRAVGSGAHPAKAMAEATGLDLETLGRRLRGYQRIAYTRVARRPSSAAAIRMTHLSAAADDLLLESVRPHETVADRPAFLQKVRGLAARHPDDRLANLTLAKAEISFGDRKAGDAILELLLAADADDADALELMGASLLAAGDDAADGLKQRELYRQARPHLIKASQKDPTRYQTLYAYARSRAVEDAYPNDNDLNALLAAHALAPQVAEITLRTAEALHRRKRSPEAIAILTPVANDPHRADAAAAAKEVLARVKPAPIPPAGVATTAPATGGAADKQP